MKEYVIDKPLIPHPPVPSSDDIDKLLILLSFKFPIELLVVIKPAIEPLFESNVPLICSIAASLEGYLGEILLSSLNFEYDINVDFEFKTIEALFLIIREVPVFYMIINIKSPAFIIDSIFPTNRKFNCGCIK